MYSELVSTDRYRDPEQDCLIGVLKGEGVGPEVIHAALSCLDAAARTLALEYSLEFGGEIGRASEAKYGVALSDETRNFCAGIFARNGAVLAGPGGGRFVYDLRREFDLYCKLTPLRPFRALDGAGCLKPRHTDNVDVLVVRENISGLYQGSWARREEAGVVRASHTFHYDEHQVRDILHAAARIAGQRSGNLCVVYKESGAPSISQLWRSCALEIAGQYGIECCMNDVDYASYRLIREASEIDVVVAPNLFGDILGDLGALLLGSRGMSYSGNFSKTGAAVYQTNHGAAYDLADSDSANPVGQILSLSMLLRESMGWHQAAERIEQAVQDVLDQGYRTFDISGPQCQTVGTRELGERIADRIQSMGSQKSVIDGDLADTAAG